MYIEHFDSSFQSSRSSDSTISCGEALLEAARMLDSAAHRMLDLTAKRAVSSRNGPGRRQ